MNKKLYLVFTYQLILLLESMVLVTAIGGYKTTLFATTLHFNLLYLPIGGILNYLSYITLQTLFKHNIPLLLTTHFIVVLLLLNTIIYFTQHLWLFQDKWTFILAHLLVADCYILAILLTRKAMGHHGSANNNSYE